MKKIIAVALGMLFVYTTNAQVKTFVAAATANEKIYAEGFNDKTLELFNFVGDKFSMADESMKVKDYIFNDLVKELPFTVLSEDVVLSNSTFNAYVTERKSGITGSIGRTAVENYLSFVPVKKDNLQELIDIFKEEGANSVMSIDMNYCVSAKTLIAGNGTAVAKIQVTIVLRDYNNKDLMTVTANGHSKGTLKVVANQIVSGKDNLPEYMQEASADLFKEMKEKLPKAIAKFEKKLAKYSK